MTRLYIVTAIFLLLQLSGQCTGFVSQTVVPVSGTSRSSSDLGHVISPPPVKFALFGSKSRDQSSPEHRQRASLMVRTFQKWKKSIIVRGQILRPLLAWCRKKYLFCVVAATIAVGCFFGPLFTLSAHAAGGNDMSANGVLVTKVLETQAMASTMQQDVGVVDNDNDVCTAKSREVAAMEEDQSDTTTEDRTSTISSNQATVQPGGAIQESESDQTTTSDVKAPVKSKSGLGSSKIAGVAAATATGGGAFAMTKRRIKRDESPLDEIEAKEEQIETKPKRVPETVPSSQSLPLCDSVHLKAREQPKSPAEEAELAARYARIDDVGERAFQILIDLGMIELHE